MRICSSLLGLALTLATTVDAQRAEPEVVSPALVAAAGSVPPIGPFLRVRLLDGAGLHGRYRGSSGDSLRIATRDALRVVALAAVDSLWESNAHIRGTTVPLMVAGAATSVIIDWGRAAIGCGSSSCFRQQSSPLRYSLGGAAVGLVAGVIIGETRRKWRLLYPLPGDL